MIGFSFSCSAYLYIKVCYLQLQIIKAQKKGFLHKNKISGSEFSITESSWFSRIYQMTLATKTILPFNQPVRII